MRKKKEILLITYAVSEELDVPSLIEVADQQQRYWFETHSTCIGRWWHDNFCKKQFGRECVLIETGVGKLNSATALQGMLHQIENECGTDVEVSVLNLGTAASVQVPIGELIECSRFVDRDLIRIPYGDKGDNIIYTIENRPVFLSELDDRPDENLGDRYQFGYSCNSGDSFVTSPDEAYQMNDGYTAVCDMEAFAQAQVLEREGWIFGKYGAKFRSVKYITDQIDGENSIETWEEELPAARLMLTREAQEAIREFFNR